MRDSYGFWTCSVPGLWWYINEPDTIDKIVKNLIYADTHKCVQVKLGICKTRDI